MSIRPRLAGSLALAAVLALTACSGDNRVTPTTSTPGSESSPALTSTAPVRPVGEPVAIASGLNAPWSILRLPDGGTLISERDTTLVRELLDDGTLRDVGSVTDARASGEGGLLGLAFLPGDDWVYAYFTTATDNRIDRMPLLGDAGSYGLGAAETVLSGLPTASNHNGGRIAFGPDRLLYATVGDAGTPGRAQDLDSLGGKILRMSPTGAVPPDNPFNTLVYSYGHRNPQGIAWDSRGRLWASEFGQNTWDELNLIEPGNNYGWPEAEGRGGNPDYVDPVQQWATSDASPSGIAIVGDTLFMASLRGERLWSVDVSPGVDSTTVTPAAWFVHDYGRLRDVASGPGGTLWFMTNNTDGRGRPSPGDDRLLEVRLERATDG
ncbi:PQQ-dependent sugar dehydrogenase [Cryobacterium psychrophilum]|uniref:PQQ-dependent sugar dehydrogenase n=1 Tax=Cryobacterium psychrophilum TaxID=41988 RepID=A0A4Y8KRD9_9MICO|nr:PQQ-dependent sugar dehydrogenase [Cryobacterium psychrophilum]TDW29742.1 glucose/arabinose dehydrogenase [Cryobacterium psychrophilum]TFD81845.1 PQQ-dependent sugar dehydrogenase [Cryobacterium psychrophilum]